MTRKNDEIPARETAIPNDQPTMAQLMALILETRKGDQAIQREQLKQTKPPSNKRGPDASVFNPQGQKDHPMPALAFDVLAPWPMSKGNYHPLTSEEVQLMNRVVPGDCVLELTDESEIRCSIIATKNMNSGVIERLAFMGARDPESNSYVTLFSKERRHLMPSMVKILRSILEQQSTDYSDVLTMAQIHTRIALPADNPQHLPVSVGE